MKSCFSGVSHALFNIAYHRHCITFERNWHIFARSESVAEPSLYAAEDIMYTLFELDEHYNTIVHDVRDSNSTSEHKAVEFESALLDKFLVEWQQRKKDLADGVISKAEYTEWKLNWPQTADECGKFKPRKQWRYNLQATEDEE